MVKNEKKEWGTLLEGILEIYIVVVTRVPMQMKGSNVIMLLIVAFS
jgi:hypothetical protein